jgi:hypothetical protein
VLRAGAETVYSEVLYGGELPAQSRPVAMRPAERIRGTQGELLTRLLGQVNGALTVRDLARASGVTEVDALIALRELKRAGYIDLKG